MKNNNRRSANRGWLCVLSIALVCLFAFGAFTAGSLITNKTAAVAETAQTATAPASDPSPAIYVAQKNANSVVGVLTYTQEWDRSSGEVKETLYAEGSGVCIREGGYVLTNNHVIESGNSYKLLLPSGEKVAATLVGTDSSIDIAILKIDDAYADQLVPVTIGSTDDLVVGSTVVAIGNPGGEIFANSVTQGIVSALKRTGFYSSNTTRGVDYIQHDAAINKGNSGGGLFDYQGNLVGINTLKYDLGSYSSASYDGLGFAIPIDTAYPIAVQLIENGKVVRPQMGVTVADYEGPDEPMDSYAPASVMINTVSAGSSAEAAGLQPYDFIYSVNDQRVTSYRELTGILDKMQAGDTITLKVVRYKNVTPVYANNNTSSYGGNGNYGYGTGGYFNPYDYFFGNGGYGYNYGYGNGGNYNGNGSSDSDSSSSAQAQDQTLVDVTVSGGYEFITVDVTLEIPED